MVRSCCIALALFASSVASAKKSSGPLETLLREIARKKQALAPLADPAIGITLVEDELEGDGSKIRTHTLRLCNRALDRKLPLLERDLVKQLRRGGFQMPREEESEPVVICNEGELSCDVWIDGEERGTWLFFARTEAGLRIGAIARDLAFQKSRSRAVEIAGKAIQRALASPCPAP